MINIFSFNRDFGKEYKHVRDHCSFPVIGPEASWSYPIFIKEDARR